MTLIKSTAIASVVLALALLAISPGVGAATGVHEATLTGSAAFPAVDGKAKFKVDNNGVRELEVEVEDANALRGVSLNIRVDGAFVGSMVVDQLGNARLRLRGAGVPAVHTGSTVAVRRASTGALVASGTFN